MARQYAFVIGAKNLPSPFLVELSRRTKTAERDLQIYQPGVRSCPKVLCPVIKSMLESPKCYPRHRMLIKGSILHFMDELYKLEEQGLDGNSIRNKLVDQVMENIIDFEVCEQIGKTNLRRWTRSNQADQEMIQMEVKSIRLMRKIQEHHLPLQFNGDYERTRNELNFVFTKYGKSDGKHVIL